jgi:hypothetical protein
MATMNANNCNIFQYDDARFDFFRLSKSKEAVDICPNTLRSYHRLGLPFHRQGKAVFISRTELAEFIRSKNLKPPVASGLPEGSTEEKGGSNAKS